MQLVKIYTLLILLVFAVYVKAEEKFEIPEYRVEYITTEQGLSQNMIDCILKDSRGFMWFGTWNGLNRFDGYNFKVYKKSDHINSISDNFIYSICEDQRGNIWIGTRNGLNVLDFVSDRFIDLSGNSTGITDPAKLWINKVYCDRSGAIWIGTNGQGLHKIIFDGKDRKYVGSRFDHIPENLQVRSVYEDNEGRLWIGTANGLYLYDEKADKIALFQNDPADISSISFNDIRCVFQDKLGDIWIGTQYGLNRWIENTGTFIRYFNESDDPLSLSHFVISDIGEDPEGELYIGTLGGLDIFNRQEDNFRHMPLYGRSNLSLNNEFINSVFCDSNGLVWIGTEKGGINKFDIYQKEFRYYAADPADEIRLDHNTINSILDEPGYLWVGTAGGGLNMIDKKNGNVHYFYYDPHNPNSLGNDFITSICRAGKSLWIGMWGGGLSRVISTKGSGQFSNYIHNDLNSTSIINNFVSTIYEDKEGNLWIGTEGGLDLFVPQKKTFIHVYNDPLKEERITEVGCILSDHRKNLWIGTRNGLFLVPREEIAKVKASRIIENIILLRSNPADTSSISENYVISLREDTDHNIWVGTYGNGLNKLIWDGDPEHRISFVHYTQEQGLSNNVVYGILEDEHKNLWLSTDYGLARFNIKEGSFTNYFVADGLRSNQFYWGACTKGVDGTLYFGGMNGVNFFKPEKIINNQYAPVPVLTELKVFNQTVEAGKPFGKRIILDKNISETREIKLNSRENTFSLEFSGLSYHLPGKNRYSYMLEGVDDDWIVVGSDRRFANYTKLKGGEYKFLLKAANNDGLWSEKPLELLITIIPPFWQRSWFRVLLIIFVVFLIILYMKLHTRSLQLQKKRLEQQVKERTTQIEDQKELLEQQANILKEKNIQLGKRQELIEGQKSTLEEQNREILDQRDRLIRLNKKVKAANQMKLKFFTNISHEFRTPLTLILSPLEKLLRNNRMENDTRELLDLINRNAGRLLHLINQLMDFRKIEKGKMTLHIQEGDIIDFIRNIRYAFNELANHRKILFDFSVEGDVMPVYFDHEKLENMIYNLLSNAFKFTPAGGKIWIRLYMPGTGSIAADGDFKQWIETCPLQIEIGDTGVGINREKLPFIFKRFYQAEYFKENALGTGIGLSLTRGLIKVYRGHINVQSEPDAGTVFRIFLPCFRDSFTSEEIIDQSHYISELSDQVNILRNILQAESYNLTDLQKKKWVTHPGNPYC